MRLLGGVAILAVLVWRVGTGPFLEAVGMIDGRALAATAAIAVLTTVCCAWRWSLVARALGVGVPLRTAVAAYYRSQFLNTVLPGGVLGDVHRGIRHGREVGAAGRGIRAVAWERSAGQLVQVMVALPVLLVLPSPVRAYVPALATGVVAAALGLVLVGRRLSARWVAEGTGPARGCRRPARRPAHPADTARHSARLHRGGGRPRGDLPDRRAQRRSERVDSADAAPGTPRAAGHGGAHERCRWGPREGVAAWAFAAAGWALPRAWPPPSCTARWCSSPACPAPGCSSPNG